MKRRMTIFLRTLHIYWLRLPHTVQVLIVLFLLLVIGVIAFSSDPGFMALLCLGMLLASLISGYIVYRLVFKDIDRIR